MSKKQWMVLLMLFLTYLLVGAGIFYHIESNLEQKEVTRKEHQRREINGLLNANYKENRTEILEKLKDFCGKAVSTDEPLSLKWDFYNSFYFAYTVVSTIGYGNLAPTSTLSRMLMIFYALVGIPVNGILLAQLGEFFSIVFIRAHKKYKAYKQNRQDDCSKKLHPLETRKAGLAVQISMYLVPGFFMFIFFPACLFSYYEGWSYEESVYYAFVTLTTIGFGDFVAGQDNTNGSGVFFSLYKAFLIAWISFGLGYIVMIMTFITRGMCSKKIIRLERKLALNIKLGQNKIWSEFNKEVGYLRRVFNELQLSKVKRVYMDEYDYETPPTTFSRSNSFPDIRQLFYGGLEVARPPCPRRRANSEVAPVELPVARVVSETDLQRIDKNATFATHAMVQPTELLARLANILGYMPPPPDDDEQSSKMETQGVEGFSDKEILASEQSGNELTWKLGDDKIPRGKPRSRTVSEVRLDPAADWNSGNQEWTWSGPAASLKIQELMKARRNKVAANKDKESKNKFASLNLPKSVGLPRWIKHLSNKKEGERNSVSVGDLSGNNDESVSHAEFSDRPTYFTHTGAANLSSTLEGSNLLEETSLADFLRALTALHTRVGAVPDEFIKKPQRKMGTASLTPPKLPSLLALFSPPPGSSSSPQSNQSTITSNTERRFSLRAIDPISPTHRKSSLATVAKRTRRFSLRPVLTPLGTSPHDSPHLSSLTRQNSRSSPPPAYSANSYAYECPREPLVSMERVPGVSSPVAAPESRRYSLRTTQTDLPPGPYSTSTTKVTPRWRAGLLQRQMNQISRQRRVRALSLSDVATENSRSLGYPRNLTPISPLALDPAFTTTMVESKDPINMTQKTVTIVSPSLEPGAPDDLLTGKRGRGSFSRSISCSNNPFTPVDPKTANTNPFVINMEDSIDANEDRTVFQVLNEVENIETAPTTIKTLPESHASNFASSPVISSDNQSKVSDQAMPQFKDKEIVDSKSEAVKQSVSDNTNRKNSVAIGYWTDSNVRDRKISTVSEQSSSSGDSKKSTSDTPRVSAEFYKTRMKFEVEKASGNSFDGNRASMAIDKDEKEEASDKLATGLEEGPRESSS